MFHHSLHLITFGCCSAHLAYRVHKSGRKTSTFTFTANVDSSYFSRQFEVEIIAENEHLVDHGEMSRSSKDEPNKTKLA